MKYGCTRCLLHKSKLESFGEWLKARGYEVMPTKGFYEVLRAKKDGDTVIIFTRENAKEHYSVQGKDYRLVKKFIRENKEIMGYGKNGSGKASASEIRKDEE